MSVLLFFLPLVFWPWSLDPANGPKWMFLSVIVPALYLFHQGTRWTHVHTMNTLWFGWSTLTLLWAVSIMDGVHALWKLLLVTILISLGISLSRVKANRCVIAFCLGVGINGILVFAQALGFDLIPQVAPPSGLFANRNYLAEAGVMALACLPMITPRWLAVSLLAPVGFATLIPKSRGVILVALILVFLAVWKRSKYWAVFLLAGAMNGALLWTEGKPIEYLMEDFSFQQRLTLWRETIAGLNLFGHGIGSYWAAFQLFGANAPEHTFDFSIGPDNPHNDILLLLSDLGVGAAIPLTLAFMAWRSGDDEIRYPLLAFGLCGLFAFPLLNPGTVAVAAVFAGVAFGARHHVHNVGMARGQSPVLRGAIGLDFDPSISGSKGKRGLSAIVENPGGDGGTDRANAGNPTDIRSWRRQKCLGASAE